MKMETKMETNKIDKIIELLEEISQKLSNIENEMKAGKDVIRFDPQDYSMWNSTWIEYRSPFEQNKNKEA